MKISSRTEYGLRAMVALAMMAGVDRPVPLRAVAESESIPEPFLDQIMAKLRRANLVTSVRGANGGYHLSRPADEISVGELVRVLEGSLAPVACVGEADSSESACDLFVGCHARNVWVRVTNAITRALDALTLADVMHDEVPLHT
ncbi:AsnC family transcriptional regulator [Alicyclobacillus hesperidum subsp. aegles]|uniref:AsnC family transcriptional regulator n=1 Tax=Alicyclobacillus hesperidum TaxID=89784 RepID=A0A1H2RNX6_9BACL|nr:Rrf2 family transcriptional regulator [Alicyclobacillus hesperidum]KRW92544.1 AsnC family transcriptional regulator [Alicyclobacillus tengchongensis]GLG00038.1 AsnC family transcriptional regulator [Alicyclobacillus hesperidum subsp. aegles]GLV13533.1 AsnC family transcriptional regulator [Alicyclobacillus hesperidum]SDW20995.1 Rrf2 family protein [Alicyclobacillus hesperidum]